MPISSHTSQSTSGPGAARNAQQLENAALALAERPAAQDGDKVKQSAGLSGIQRRRVEKLHALLRHREALDMLDACLAALPGAAPAAAAGEMVTEMAPHESGQHGWMMALANTAENYHEVWLDTEAAREYGELFYLRAKILCALDEPDEALKTYDRALGFLPQSTELLQDRASLLAALNRHDEAAAGFAEAVRIKPNMPEVHLDEGLSRLAAGDFLNGWKKYEWRWQTARLGPSRRSFDQPLWLGRQSLEGKTILLHAEQAVEDTIQFCRYARRAAALGAQVLLEAPVSLVPLLRQLDGVAGVYAEGEQLPDFDYHCPLLSLPLAFGTTLPTIPITTCYLSPPAEMAATWQQRLSGSPLLRVGLHWADIRPDKGSIKGVNNRGNHNSRSIPLKNFLRLVYGRACYVCLQRDIDPAEQALLDQHRNILRVDELLADPATDLSDMVALIASLDLVITNESVVAHLAAAMGKPVWLLISSRPGWRWMLERCDSPWYPSVRLFRQPAAHDWDSVVDLVAHELDRWRA